MNTKRLLIGAALAGITMASAGCAEKTAEAATGECHGVNACKGHGDCGGKDHNCGGKNECKGQGWEKMTQADCDAKGGEFVAKGAKKEASH